jgi:hypothetical protein
LELLFPLGLQKEKMKTYIGADNEISTPFGFDLGASYSFIIHPQWHISLGGGTALLFISEKKGSETSSSSNSWANKWEVVPNIQASLNWRPSRRSPVFIRVGYRGDFYPKNYVHFLFKAPPAEPKGFFLGHSLMFGVLAVPARW